MDWPSAFASVGGSFAFAMIVWFFLGTPWPSRRVPAPQSHASSPEPMWSSSEVKVSAPEGVDPAEVAAAVKQALDDPAGRFKKS